MGAAIAEIEAAVQANGNTAWIGEVRKRCRTVIAAGCSWRCARNSSSCEGRDDPVGSDAANAADRLVHDKKRSVRRHCQAIRCAQLRQSRGTVIAAESRGGIAGDPAAGNGGDDSIPAYASHAAGVQLTDVKAAVGS